MAFVPLLAAGLVGGGSAALGASAATAIGLGSTVFTGLSSYQGAQYQAAVAKNNQIIAMQNAQAESEAAQTRQVRSDQDYAALLGEQTALQGASGLDILGRSQVATRQLTRRTQGLAAQDIRREGEVRTQGFQMDAVNAGIERSAAQLEGRAALGQMVLGLGTGIANDRGLSRSLASGARSVRRRLPF